MPDTDLTGQPAPGPAGGREVASGHVDQGTGEIPAAETEMLFAQLTTEFVEWVKHHAETVEVFTLERTGTPRWCPQWWEHTEVTARLKALWLGYEAARDGGGTEMSSWWLFHWDPSRALLFADNGPFRTCSIERGHLWNPRNDTLPIPADPPDTWRLPTD